MRSSFSGDAPGSCLGGLWGGTGGRGVQREQCCRQERGSWGTATSVTAPFSKAGEQAVGIGRRGCRAASTARAAAGCCGPRPGRSHPGGGQPSRLAAPRPRAPQPGRVASEWGKGMRHRIGPEPAHHLGVLEEHLLDLVRPSATPKSTSRRSSMTPVRRQPERTRSREGGLHGAPHRRDDHGDELLRARPSASRLSAWLRPRSVRSMSLDPPA